MADTSHPLTDDRWVNELMSGGDRGAAPAAGTVQSGEVAFDVDDTGPADTAPATEDDDCEAVTDPNLEPVAAPAADEAPVDLDAPDAPAAEDDATGATPVDAGAKRTAVALGVGLVVAVTAIVAALVSFSDDSASTQPRSDVPAAMPVAQPQPVPTSAAPTVPQDQSLPYTASAPCAAGSTSAQSLTDTATDSAWVCARGSRDEALEGKVLTVDFGKTYMISGVEATPGWVAKTPGGQDRWLQHRVVTRLQYIFLNGNVVSDIYTQDTGNVHGPVTAALPRRVLASRVNVVVLQTSRPPTSPLPAADPAGLPEAQPGLVESLLGEGGGSLSESPQSPEPYPDLTVPGSGSDPVDNTFAMSALKFLGYQP
ncbi:hypothetical protein [Mycolicibacterium tusciae]|uniref:hypothetical protein n=1 Tax=Mycolicibacterium tusciae TaxID=75922 RepID=UPI00024A4311|nr:hypothetical protein [Mycolicibacterium tusciae]